ncbi:MAG: M18 family aminopeptidase [Bacilli bacterium]|nr:M18 family aminopeptidase [Bacilli bacterium]
MNNFKKNIHINNMNNEKFNDNLINFIKDSSCSFTCVKKIKDMLIKNGFIELFENNIWNFNSNKFFIVRNDASIIAFIIPKIIVNSFSIITTHLDTPSLLLKPNGAYIKDNYLKYNVMPYGGLLNYGWLDHPLSLSGRIIIKKNNILETKIIDFKKPMLIIPSVAIHQNDTANINLDLNMQTDMQPILSLTKNLKTWNDILKETIKEDIIDYDLFAYNTTNPTNIGINKELLISPRIDNLTSVYSSLMAFLDSKDNNIKVFCSFNNEEIGSLTEEGADSNFLIDTLKRVSSTLKIDIATALANSFIISSDNTQAIHPNHKEYADDTAISYLGNGFTIIKELSSTTNALSSSIIKTICKKHKIKYQDSTAKNDIAKGSTLSGISLRHVSVLSIDVGISQLAMHSSLEVCSTKDIYELYKMMKAFYETKIVRNKTKYSIE